MGILCRKMKLLKILKQYWFCFAIIAITIIIRCYVLQISYIPSNSMENTLRIGDYAIGTKYDTDKIDRYDIIVFIPTIPEEKDKLYVKRVIGLPGEEIVIKNGTASANGVLLDSSFTKSFTDTSGDGIYNVPQGSYFVMGDNRDESYDSRFWEIKYVPHENIVSKTKVVIYPFDHFQVLKTDF